MIKPARGFTLIELLVSISIIGLLASVIIASLSKARLAANDAKIKQQVIQMRNLLELDYSENNNSFTNLQVGWFSSATQCNTTGASGGTFIGPYTTKAREICNAIVSNSTASNFVGQIFYIGNSVDLSSKYGIMAYLPGKQAFFCMGSSGKTSDITDTIYYSANGWAAAGCYSNP